MKQTVLFEPEVTFPASDKILFDVCNNAHNHWMQKQSFYLFKAKILEKYATKAEWKRWGEVSQGKANFIEAFAAWCNLELHKENTDDLPF